MLPGSWALLGLQVALAGEAVKLEVVRVGQEGASPPALLLTPAVAAERLDVSVDCGGVHAERSGPAPAGEQLRLELPVPLGTWQCRGRLAGVFADGSEGEMPLSFQVQLLPPLDIRVDRSSLDLEAHRLSFTADRPLSRVEVAVYGDAGRELGRGAAPLDGVAPGQPATVEWAGQEGEVFRIHLVVTDTNGLWTALDLFPWSYSIPHEDVNFETARWEILPSEEPKLQAALDRAREVLGRYTLVDVPMKLYVGGYTDTVGDRASNQLLSERRARAIAAWFREHGFDRPIYYQGFGEDALRVPTEDEVDELRNRRATYVLAAEAPPVSPDFPRANWKRLE